MASVTLWSGGRARETGPGGDAPSPGLTDARRLGTRILAASVLAALLVVGAAWLHRVWDRDQDIGLWRGVAESEARSFASNVRQTLATADTQVRAVQDRLRALQLTGDAHFEAVVTTRGFHEQLRELRALIGESAILSVADAQGRLLSFSHAFPPRSREGGRIDVSDAPFFRALQDDPALALAVGMPRRNHVDGGWRFHLARPVRSVDGRFLGVIFSGIDSEALSGTFARFAIEGKRFLLFHESGAVLARWPADPAYAIGADRAGSLAMRVFRSGRPTGVFRAGEVGVDPANARELRVLAAQRVGDYPVVAALRYGEPLVLAAWKRGAADTWALAGLVAALLLGAGYAVRTLLVRRAEHVAAILDADAKLRRQEAETRKLALVARRTDNAVLLSDREGRTVWVNEGFTRITGYAPAEILGRTPGSVLQGADTDAEARRRIAQRLKAGEGFREELLNYGRDGRPYWLAVEVQPTRDEQGRHDGFMAIERDITIEKLALNGLRMQHAVSELLLRAASLEEVLPALMRTLGEHGDWRIVQAWSAKEGRLHWRGAWQSARKPAPDFADASRATLFLPGQGAPGRVLQSASPVEQPDHDTDPTDPRVAAAAADALGDGLCVPVLCGGKLEGVLEFAGRRLRLADAEMPRTLQSVANLLGQFISRRRAERELRAAVGLAERATRAKGRFIATVSHEIRTPLNAVVGMISLIEDARLPEPLRDQLGVVREASEQLMAVVNDVLDLSRLESGRVQVRQAAFRPRVLVDQVVRIAKGLPGAQALEIVQEVGEGVPEWLTGDEPRLTQVLLNLAGNAVKFTPSGRVTIEVDMAPDAGGGPPRVAFTVRDTGIGIAPEHAERIFEPFEQAPAQAVTKGTGLGLAICRRIAELLDGTLQLQSAVGQGSSFRMVVPLPPAQAPARAAGAGPQPGRLGRLRILLAEDTPASQLVARLILERLGHEVTAVDDGEQAVESFARGEFDAVFLDIQMPRMNGIDAARAMRRLGARGATLPIIGLSAYVQESDQSSALAGGMTHYMPKPVRLEDVDRLLHQIFSGDGAVLPR